MMKCPSSKQFHGDMGMPQDNSKHSIPMICILSWAEGLREEYPERPDVLNYVDVEMKVSF